MAPRHTLSLATLSPRGSGNDEAYSIRRAGTDDSSGLAEHLNHRLSCLPPVDTGKHAYLFLLACFVLSALVWSESIFTYTSTSPVHPVAFVKKQLLTLYACSTSGYSFCFGILSDYYSRTEPFKESSAIANIGTCCSGIMYLGGFPALLLNRIFPRWARFSPLIGLLILCAALCASAWATNVTMLIITQGIFYGLGGAIAYTPCTMYIDVGLSFSSAA